MSVVWLIVIGVTAFLAIGYVIFELDVRGHRSAQYLIPLFLSAILIAVLVVINRGARATLEFMGATLHSAL